MFGSEMTVVGGVAAEHRPVLDEDDLRPVPGRRHRRAHAGQPAAADDKFRFEGDVTDDRGVLFRPHRDRFLGGRRKKSRRRRT